MEELARIAARSVGSGACVEIEKLTEGNFNKAFLMTMDDGREVIAKVPNPNAGYPHFNTASEVATMEFVHPPHPCEKLGTNAKLLFFRSRPSCTSLLPPSTLGALTPVQAPSMRSTSSWRRWLELSSNAYGKI
jgi:hypothetical protein